MIMKKKVFLFIICLTFLLTFTGCIYFVLIDKELVLIAPTVISAIGTIAILCSLIIEIFVGHKEYDYNNEILYVRRKNKIIVKIEKQAIENVILVCDTGVDDLYIVSFKHGGKKHYIAVNSHNKDNILNFIEGIDYGIKKNYWYYLIYLLDILLI